MEYMLENSINVHDDILQKELSKSSDEKMKNIVATIQRDQNAIIRNETSRTLIIQGVAGSGKTSIALHRIAFLLYRFKEDLSSKDILIVSPNKVFADYISNVLLELGEDKIPEQGMEELTSEILENKVKFQTFFEQVALLLEKNDESYKERIKFKSSAEFMLKLDQFIAYMENEFFSPADLVLKKRIVVPQWFFKEKFENFHRLPLLKRLPEIARETEENINFYYNYELSADERNEIRKTINDMFRITNLRELYKAFYDWLNIPHLLKPVSHSRLEYADVFPLIYLKIRLEGSKNDDRVKHLLVDEMQDYTPIQYAVLSR
jgi:DNA helicase-2/ATP-dependent DNA helicase PcrA